MKYRITYNNKEVISIIENNSSFTYTADNMIVATLYDAGVYLRTIGIDTEMIDVFNPDELDNKNYCYFIIPLDLVSNLDHYATWVKEAYPNKIFDIALESITVEIEGKAVAITSNILKMIPCGITHFNDEGIQLLDAIIEGWNIENPNKAIAFDVKFNSLADLETFIENAR